MSLYENWLRSAYNQKGESNPQLWEEYLPLEQKIYETILENPKEIIKGTVASLAERFNMSDEYFCGVVDGINECISNPVDMEHITSETEVVFDVELENLYKKMVEYKAEDLYSLPQWLKHYTKEDLEKFYKEQKSSRTVVRAEKIGRNDPCPCGSGKKYKKCCAGATTA